MAIAVGDKIPTETLKLITEDGPADIEIGGMLDGKKVVLFAVPGAFTPTCTLNHLPGFIENADAIKSKGIDEIAVVAVNDPFVMQAWADNSGAADKIKFLADWDAAFTKEMGLEIDLGVAGLGVRSKRYSMIINDGTVEALNIEETPGTADASGAAQILAQL
ncbi:MAG: peroxiredoxin [Pseudomonadota bacterium]